MSRNVGEWSVTGKLVKIKEDRVDEGRDLIRAVESEASIDPEYFDGPPYPVGRSSYQTFRRLWWVSKYL